jgi:hypothetical protein
LKKEKKKLRIDLSYQFGPIKNVRHIISEIMGNFNEELFKTFYSKIISKRINTIISELINNVLANTKDKESFFSVKISSFENELKITVKNKVTLKQYNLVKDHVKKINNHNSPKKLLEETIKHRRQKELRGGLGLIRIVSEEKAKLQVRFINNSLYMSVITKIKLNEEEEK